MDLPKKVVSMDGNQSSDTPSDQVDSVVLNGIGLIDVKLVHFRLPDLTNEDYGPEISD
jgi:hypothetical protein